MEYRSDKAFIPAGTETKVLTYTVTQDSIIKQGFYRFIGSVKDYGLILRLQIGLDTKPYANRSNLIENELCPVDVEIKKGQTVNIIANAKNISNDTDIEAFLIVEPIIKKRG